MSFNPIDDDGADKFGNLVSVETFQTLANNLNAMMKSMPVGAKVPILIGLPGVPDPDPSIWQPCEGGVTIDQRSPLRDQVLPDDRGRYPKGASTVGQAGQVDGSNERSFSHSHGGNTEDFDAGKDNGDNDDDFITIDKLHHHSISADLVEPYNVEPVHIRLKFYIKIR
jgi:hypothetical protein